METREYPRVMPGVEVFDVDGRKVGTVSHLHEPAGAGGSPASAPPAAHAGTLGGAVFEVKTGPFGLGKHYFIPFSAVKDVTVGGVFLNTSRADFEARGWLTRPTSAVEA